MLKVADRLIGDDKIYEKWIIDMMYVMKKYRIDRIDIVSWNMIAFFKRTSDGLKLIHANKV